MKKVDYLTKQNKIVLYVCSAMYFQIFVSVFITVCIE